MYKLRTIDVWDTLLRRDCHPECIKLATAYHLCLGWGDELRTEYRDHWVVYRLRLDAELHFAEEARSAGRDDEYAIEMVVARWFELCVGRVPQESEVAQLVEFEISVEISRSFPDEGIVRYLEAHPAERTLFLSDFYMGAHQLKRLLDHHGFTRLVPDGISSCDVGFNKRSGRLFRHVHELYGVEPAEHFHFGDNHYSDVEAPTRLGINARHYLPMNAHNCRGQNEALFSSRATLFAHIEKEVAELVRGNDASVAFALGARLAPLFVGFSLHVAEKSLLGKVDALYFLSREGEFFHEVFNLVFPEGHLFGHRLPSAVMLEVSRQSTFLPSLDDPGIENFARVWRLPNAQKVSGIFHLLSLDLQAFTPLLQQIGLSMDETIIDPSSDVRLKELFASEAFAREASASIESARQQFGQYLDSKGFGANSAVGFVDIGWRGTIQDNIALLAPTVDMQGFYLAFRTPVNEQPGNVSKSGYLIDQRFDQDWHLYADAFAAMEMLCSSLTGTVTGYQITNSGALAVREPDEDGEPESRQFVAAFQLGVLAATKVWKPYLARYVISAAELREIGRSLWRGVLKFPPDELVKSFVDATHKDVFGSGNLCIASDAPGFKDMAFSLFSAKSRRELVLFIRRVQWPEAVLSLKELSSFHRYSLYWLFRGAKFIRRMSVSIRRIINGAGH